MLTALASEPQGRLRALVADVSGAARPPWSASWPWTLVADGWRALRPHDASTGGCTSRSRRVIPGGPATDLAPVLAR